jgi:hypothetical protein
MSRPTMCTTLLLLALGVPAIASGCAEEPSTTAADDSEPPAGHEQGTDDVWRFEATWTMTDPITGETSESGSTGRFDAERDVLVLDERTGEDVGLPAGLVIVDQRSYVPVAGEDTWLAAGSELSSAFGDVGALELGGDQDRVPTPEELVELLSSVTGPPSELPGVLSDGEVGSIERSTLRYGGQELVLTVRRDDRGAPIEVQEVVPRGVVVDGAKVPAITFVQRFAELDEPLDVQAPPEEDIVGEAEVTMG